MRRLERLGDPTKGYIASLAAAALITGCSPDPIENYGTKTLRMVRSYPDSNCISFLYDLDGDNKIELVEFRRWNKQGEISPPIKAFYDKNGDLEITCDEVAKWPDPLPGSGSCPPEEGMFINFGNGLAMRPHI